MYTRLCFVACMRVYTRAAYMERNLGALIRTEKEFTRALARRRRFILIVLSRVFFLCVCVYIYTRNNKRARLSQVEVCISLYSENI